MEQERSKRIEDAYGTIHKRASKVVGERTSDGQTIIMVGNATCSRAAGAEKTLDFVKQEVSKRDIPARVVQVGCMGHCYAEPLMIINKSPYPSILYGYVDTGLARTLIDKFILGDDPCMEFMLGAVEQNDLLPTLDDIPRYGNEYRLLLRHCGFIDPEDIFNYIDIGGYKGLARALNEDPDDIIQTIKGALLRGLGGGGFPTGRKWELCAGSGSETRYIICNADEGDPGAFMDRSLLESNPHKVLEGIIIGGYAIKSSQGFIYVRAEYPLAVKRLTMAVQQAERHGLLGENILGSGFNFNLEVVRGAGAFVCGESSALMYAIEGKRGMPRVRPPRSIEYGFTGKPTVLNNVKTFAHIPMIILDGGKEFLGIGTEHSKGTAMFALAGSVVNTGLVEVPMGCTLRSLIFDIGGGITKGKKFKAVQIGGPSGGCLPEKLLDIPVDFDTLQEAGAMMGSGGMVVLDENACMVETARFFLEFTQKESCGKCTLCRLGTKQMLDIMNDIVEGKGSKDCLDKLLSLSEDIKGGSLCNLGRTAPNPVLSTMRYFREEYEAHIHEKRCPALMCHSLMVYYIIPHECERSCDVCVGSCPVEAIYPNKKRIKVIDQEKCIKCSACYDVCPPEYSAVVKLSPISLLEKESSSEP